MATGIPNSAPHRELVVRPQQGQHRPSTSRPHGLPALVTVRRFVGSLGSSRGSRSPVLSSGAVASGGGLHVSSGEQHQRRTVFRESEIHLVPLVQTHLTEKLRRDGHLPHAGQPPGPNHATYRDHRTNITISLDGRQPRPDPLREWRVGDVAEVDRAASPAEPRQDVHALRLARI